MTTALEARLAPHSAKVLSIFRIIVGLLFLLHGTAKLFAWPADQQAAVGAWPAWWAGLIEVVVGILVTVGLQTRLAAFIGSGQMAVAYFLAHWPPLQGPSASFWPTVNGGETALLFCFGLLLIATAGPGVWAIDSRRRAGYATTQPAGAPQRRGGLLGRLRNRR